VDSFPPSTVENEPYAINEAWSRNLCGFVTLLLSMPPMDGIGCDVNVIFEGRSSDGPHPRIVVFMDLTLWKDLMFKKDLNLETLRWFLLLQQFNFESAIKGDWCLVYLYLKKALLGRQPKVLFLLPLFLSFIFF